MRYNVGAQGEATVEQTDVGSYFVANYPPFSRVERRRPWPATPRPRSAARRRADVPLGCTCTSRSAGSAATSATSGSTPTRTRARSSSISICSAREWELYARQPAVAGPPLQLRLLRRRHAVVPLDQAAAGPGRPAERRRRVERRRRDHLRVRARHADRSQARARSASWASRASASASRTSTIASSRSTAARTARRKSAAPTTRRARSAFRRSTSTSSPACSARPTRTGSDCIERTLALDPDSVTIYQMELPYNTTISGDMLKGAGQFAEPVAGLGDQAALGAGGVRARSSAPAITSAAPTPR